MLHLVGKVLTELWLGLTKITYKSIINLVFIGSWTPEIIYNLPGNFYCVVRTIFAARDSNSIRNQLNFFRAWVPTSSSPPRHGTASPVSPLREIFQITGLRISQEVLWEETVSNCAEQEGRCRVAFRSPTYGSHIMVSTQLITAITVLDLSAAPTFFVLQGPDPVPGSSSMITDSVHDGMSLTSAVQVSIWVSFSLQR